MTDWIQGIISSNEIATLLERLLCFSVQVSQASGGLLVLFQDLLLAEKRLIWLDLTPNPTARKGGYIFSSILSDRATSVSSDNNQFRRRALTTTALKGIPMTISDAAKHSQVLHGNKALGIGSAFCVPIKKTEEIGLLYLEHPIPRHFNERLVEDLTLLVEIAATELHNKLNEALDHMLARFTSRLISAESRTERRRLVEMILNEFKLRLGFGQVVFLKVVEDRGVAEIERSIFDEPEKDIGLQGSRLSLAPQDDLIDVLLRDKKIASVEGVTKQSDTVFSCYINGKSGQITNNAFVTLIEHLYYNPFLAIPLYLPNGVSGILVADKGGLPIILGNAVQNFFISLSSTLSLALNWADEYQDMKHRLARMYEERLRRESLTEVGSIIGEVSHVIASPIKHLITTLDRLARKDFSQEIRSNIVKMVEWSSKIKNYLFYVQDLAKTEELEPVLATNDLEQCIKNAWQERVAPFYPNITLELVSGESNAIEPFPFDSLQITSLFSNLFMNAARAMEGKGNVIKVGTKVADDMVKVSIEDSGHGIPEEILCDFFNIDRRIDYMSPEKGRGRGTLICKEIIKRHRGSIEIWSTGGRFVTSYSEKASEKSAYFDASEKRTIGTMVTVSLPYRSVQTEGCDVN